MRDETLALHAGFDADPATKAVAVPIYQTAAYHFDTADQGAALFNLEEEGYRYSRIANPTVAVLEERVAALEGAAGALATASGQAALYYAFANVARGRAEYRFDAAALRHHPHPAAHRAAGPGRGRPLCRRRQRRGDGRLHGRQYRRGVLRDGGQSGRQYLRHRGHRAHGACPWRAADRGQYGGDADAAEAGPPWRRHRGAFADQIHGRPWQRHGRHRWWMAAISTGWRMPRAFPQFTTPDHSYHGLVYAERFGSAPSSPAPAASISAPPAPSCRR